MIEITATTSIAEQELSFTATRSSGPGGQNVNKVNTRVTLFFDVAGSPSLSEGQKQRLLGTLSTRIDKQGVLRVVSQKHRTQQANRRAAVERFQGLLQEALRRRPVRKKTRPSAGARQRRLRDKKRRSAIKQERAKKDWRQAWDQ